MRCCSELGQLVRKSPVCIWIDVLLWHHAHYFNFPRIKQAKSEASILDGSPSLQLWRAGVAGKSAAPVRACVLHARLFLLAKMLLLKHLKLHEWLAAVISCAASKMFEHTHWLLPRPRGRSELDCRSSSACSNIEVIYWARK